MHDFSRAIRSLIDGAARPVTADEAVARTTSHGGSGRHDAQAIARGEEGLWLEDGVEPARTRIGSRRLVVVGAAVVLSLAILAVPIALVATAGHSTNPSASGSHHPASGAAQHQVIAALGATTDSGSFNFSYDLSNTAAATTTTTNPCPQVRPAYSNGGNGSASGTAMTYICGPQPAEGSVTGSGVINTNPMAMVASAHINGGLDVVVRVDSQNVYEDSGNGATSGLAPPAADANASGQALPSFAGLVEGTLGSRDGAVAMLGMASPTGYLDLYQQDITSAAETGTGTVDGVAVTEYQVNQSLDQLTTTPGLTSNEVDTITAATHDLEKQGYASDTVDVSIDGAGYIRQVKSVVAFKDGGTSTLEATFSDFGCAGTVLMPGQQGSGTPPSGCTSPDTGNDVAAAKSSVNGANGPAATVPTTIAPKSGAASTTVPPASTTTTSGVTPTTVAPATVGSTAVTATTTTTVPSTTGR
jgi:hypothetical protein